MNKTEVRSNAVPPSPYHNVIFCVLGRGIGNYRGSRSGKW